MAFSLDPRKSFLLTQGSQQNLRVSAVVFPLATERHMDTHI
jgi:hypothetical protein